MKKQDFINVGIREDCIDEALSCVKNASKDGRFHGVVARKLIKDVAQTPTKFTTDPHFGSLAKRLLEESSQIEEKFEPKPYQVWGELDEKSREQMDVACAVPVAVRGAILPDNHSGFGLPVGGVLACKNAVIPFCVGVDISCRMQLSITDISVESLEKELRSGMRRGDKLSEALQDGTRFGIGSTWNPKHEHPVLDMDWNVSPVTKAMKDRAWSQLGTSGAGNHFCSFGVLTVPNKIVGLQLEPGIYVALITHSGSRGTGSAVCNEYSRQATAKLDKRYRERFGRLAWLDLDTQAGQEYWNAMNLMAEYARANHTCIHQTVTKLLGATIIATVQNEHNLAWKEHFDGEELIVHRKGATPAGAGIIGVIPGTMADPCYVVIGKGNLASLNSASHGAGRRMSRTEAKKKFRWSEWKSILKQRGVRLLSAGLDEVPGAYKDIKEVMAAQMDLVDIVAEFMPRIVKMSDDGRSED